MTDRLAHGPVHIIDDDPGARESLLALLTAAGLSAQVHPSGGDFLRRSRELAPACLIVDVRMPDMSGLELLERLARSGPLPPTVVVTGHADVPMAVQAMKLGAVDFIEKPFRADTILASVRQAIACGARSADPARAQAARRLIDTLTEREREVLVHLAQGGTNKAVARRLGISPRTVETHRARVMAKLRARSLSEVVRTAMTAGIL